MDKAKSISTPMHPSQFLEADDKVGDKVSDKPYRGMIGLLFYLIASRPDIQLSVGICARFQSNPKQSHLNAIKRILRYLVGTTNSGLWYKKGTFCNVKGYYDAYFAGDRVKRKGISSCYCFLGKSLITWSSKKQNTITFSTTEADMYLQHIAVLKFCGLSIS